MSEPCLSGQTVINSRQSLEEIAGKEVVLRALEDLPDDERERYLSITEDAWLPVRIADGRLRLTVPSVDVHEVIAIDDQG